MKTGFKDNVFLHDSEILLMPDSIVDVILSMMWVSMLEQNLNELLPS